MRILWRVKKIVLLSMAILMAILLALFTPSSSALFAKEGNSSPKGKTISLSKLMFIASPGAYAKDEDQGLKINDHTKFELKFDEDTQQFDISGEITAVAGNNFVVSGQTIFIDPSQVQEFEQKGILAVGKRVKVEGIIKNGIKFAQEINVIGTGAGRFKFETENQPMSVGTTSSSNIQVKVKANGPAQLVKSFLDQILTLLKSLIS